MNVFERLVFNVLEPMKFGSLKVSLPDGKVRVFGGLSRDLQAEIAIRDDGFFRRCVLFGPIGFAESYMAGEWESPALEKVVAWFILNARESGALEMRGGRRAPGLDLLNVFNRALHWKRPNSLRQSKSNIRDHYDLGNDFFRLWLDPSMLYSCGYFDPPTLDLESAQRKKCDVLCTKLQLLPKDHVLEIGSGWGGFAIHAASTFGCRVTTITISEEQFREATERIALAGLSDRIEVRLEDYRETKGYFDKIVSIEMLEAVGDRYLETFFERCHALLKPQGLMGLQYIICPDAQHAILRGGVDFIQKHIFPGSLLLSLRRVHEAIFQTGELNLLDLEDMGSFYARTLRLWREGFEGVLEQVRAMGFDEPFVRKWRYYLAYCEAAFATRHISVVQAVYTRPNNLALASPAYDVLSANPLEVR